MAVIEKRVLRYISALIGQKWPGGIFDTWMHDPILAALDPELTHEENLLFRLSGKEVSYINNAKDPVGSFSFIFSKAIIRNDISIEVERKCVALKLGFVSIPATTTKTILEGFDINLPYEDILDIFVSHGLSLRLRKITEKRNFIEINRRVAGWNEALRNPNGEQSSRIKIRYKAISKWLLTKQGDKSKIFEKIPMKRSLFFHWWNNFRRLGLLGLADTGQQLFRHSKIGPKEESKIVIDKLQHPDRADSFYARRLKSQGIDVGRNAISKVFTKWDIQSWNSKFVSNLSRLEDAEQEEYEDRDEPISKIEALRKVERKFSIMLEGLRDHCVPFSAPGLPILWAYLEDLNIISVLNNMGLTEPVGKDHYSWTDLLLFDIGRRFFGIPTLSGACQSGCPELAWFAQLYASPCNDTVLEGLTKISEKQVKELRNFLVERISQLGLSNGKKIAFDFHHIDMDVLYSKLRGFGKGPSPRKKICDIGFRPHVAVDVESGTLLVVEFRKASARGTTTVRKFANDYIMPTFQGLFETVYIDSEYTGKDVWNFILDGMKANLTACLRQNALVKKHRDNFLSMNEGKKGFWYYYDDGHEYTTETFPISWEYISTNNETKELNLFCVIKRNIKTGSLRCFGTSKQNLSAIELLNDYSARWVIENIIKDLIQSYFLDQCPGTNPHAVDIHFLITTICRTLYRMIEQDLMKDGKNSDGSTKTLRTMRDMLFRQGAAELNQSEDGLTISFLHPYRLNQTNILRDWFHKVSQRHTEGLQILGGQKLTFKLLAPRGEEFRNSGEKVEFLLEKI